MARRGHEVVEVVAETGAGVGDRASEAWRDTRPLRRQAAKRAAQATRDAAKWSNRTWRTSLRPMLKDIWKRRTVAIAAAGAAVPAAQELVDSTAVRLGLREEEEHRHWGAFFLGLLVGAAAGAIAALLTAPKRGEEMRRELAVKADEVRNELAVKADEVRNELAARAKDADWVPIFQSDQPTNGHGTEAVGDPSGSVQEAAASGSRRRGRGRQRDGRGDQRGVRHRRPRDSVVA